MEPESRLNNELDSCFRRNDNRKVYSMKLTFYGAARQVTGSNYLLEATNYKQQTTKILIDCGLHQGPRYCEDENFKPFPYDPKEIEAVFVTHAHIDHIGRLPQLYRQGFRGAVYSTAPTKDFAEQLLLDSEHILAKEAGDRNKPPIYTIEDVNNVLGLWHKRKYHEPVAHGPFTVEFYDAGHILGSSFIVVEENVVSPKSPNGDRASKRVVFSGDVGNVKTPIVKDTEAIDAADYAIIESTYGGRIHENVESRRDHLEDAIEDVVKAGGTLMIPAFAMERTQDLLFELNQLVEDHRIPRVPVFIDSPLAIKLTTVYKKYSADPLYVDEDALAHLRRGDAIFDFPGLTFALTTEQSKAINDVKGPKIVIAGSGMSNGGRILHHERRYLSDPKSTILFIGYQAQGTLGRRILDGAQTVTIFGEEIPVHCRKRAISGYSAHADQKKLIGWIRPMKLSLKKIFLVHGEEDESNSLAVKIRDELAIDAHIPHSGETVML